MIILKVNGKHMEDPLCDMNAKSETYFNELYVIWSVLFLNIIMCELFLQTNGGNLDRPLTLNPLLNANDLFGDIISTQVEKYCKETCIKLSLNQRYQFSNHSNNVKTFCKCIIFLQENCVYGNVYVCA